MCVYIYIDVYKHIYVSVYNRGIHMSVCLPHARMNTATIRFFTLPLKRFLDLVFWAAFSIRQLIFY